MQQYFSQLMPMTHKKSAQQTITSIHAAIFLSTNAHDTQEIGTTNHYQCLNASDMQSGCRFFWYQFLVTNSTCFIFVPVYGTSFRYQFLVHIVGITCECYFNGSETPMNTTTM